MKFFFFRRNLIWSWLVFSFLEWWSWLVDCKKKLIWSYLIYPKVRINTNQDIFEHLKLTNNFKKKLANKYLFSKFF